MDIYETEKDLVIIVELPGATPEDLEISFGKGVLKIGGRREGPLGFSCTKCHRNGDRIRVISKGDTHSIRDQ